MSCACALQVFVTVGTAAKRKFLLAAFPKLQEDHIGDSRSSSFEGMVMNLTRGKGVHLALNSLADEKLQASIDSSEKANLKSASHLQQPLTPGHYV